jgi:hypothetical protein
MKRLDLSAIFGAVLAAFILWATVVVYVTFIARQPGVVCMTPMAWLMALWVGMMCVARSRSVRKATLLTEAGLAGGLFGLLQGALFVAVAILFMEVKPDERQKMLWISLMMITVGTLNQSTRDWDRVPWGRSSISRQFYRCNVACNGYIACTNLVWSDLVSARQFSEWGPPVNAELIPGTSPELNTPFNDGCPIQSPDGRSLFIASNQPGGLDIWTAVRESTDDDWSTPVNLGAPINSEADETRAPLSWDGRTMVFGSTRPGSELGPNGLPSNDVYVTTREKLSGKDR